MKIILILLFLLFSFNFIFGQTISSQLKDAKSHTPIQYATIGIVGENIGTVSDSLGNFQLSLTRALDTDTLRISMIGYSSLDYKVDSIRMAYFPKIIGMNEQIILLQEAVISKENNKPFQLGLKKKYGYPIPLYKGAESKVAFPQKNYRHEIGTRFTNQKMISLDSVQLNFAECNTDVVKLRLNIYTINGNVIENSLRRPIYIYLTKSEALNSPTIKLKEHIEVDSDFLITLENYKLLKDGAVYLFANFKRKAIPYPTYYRNSSQGHWIRLKSKKSKPIAVSILAFGH